MAVKRDKGQRYRTIKHGRRERREGGGKREERSEREIYTFSCMRDLVTLLHNTALV